MLATELSYRMKANRCRDFCQAGRSVMESNSQDRQRMMVQEFDMQPFPSQNDVHS
jgi:hypothetical protein